MADIDIETVDFLEELYGGLEKTIVVVENPKPKRHLPFPFNIPIHPGPLKDSCDVCQRKLFAKSEQRAGRCASCHNHNHQ